MPESWLPVGSLFGAWHKLRTYNKGVTGHEQFVIPTTARKVSARVFASTFRIAGLASADHDICRLENASGSSILMAVRRLSVQMDSTAVDTTGIDKFGCYKVTSSLATGGTASTKHLFDSADSTSSSAIFAGAASADGTASAITWTTPGGTPGWQQFLTRVHTAVGQVLTPDLDLIPRLCEGDPIILRAGEQLVVSVKEASLATNHYILQAVWDEFTLP